MEEIRAVIDTSALLSRERKPLLFFAQRGLYKLVWSPYIIEELQDVMKTLKVPPGKIKNFVNIIEGIAIEVNHEEIEGGSYEKWLKDPDDHPIMATALAGKVNYIVTWNTKDFPPKRRFAGITIVTPDAFLKILGTKRGRG